MSDREFWATLPYAERMHSISAFTWYHFVNPDFIQWELL